MIDHGDHVFYVMHKPAEVVCQRHPREPNVYNIIPEPLRRSDLACVGRLDRDTTGTLLLTTDGGVQSMLLFPTSRVWKIYTASLHPNSSLAVDAEAQFGSGMQLADGTRCAPAMLQVLNDHQVRVKVHEGFFHQVKRMLLHVGGVVTALHRDRFGLIDADGLAPGEMRALTPSEVGQLVDMLPVDRVAKLGLEQDRTSAGDAVDGMPNVATGKRARPQGL